MLSLDDVFSNFVCSFHFVYHQQKNASPPNPTFLNAFKKLPFQLYTT